jgi:hypothetical protein
MASTPGTGPNQDMARPEACPTRPALASGNEQRAEGGGAKGTGNDNTTKGRGEGARRKRKSSKKPASPRNHEELRSAVFEHRHQHKKAPAAPAGPCDAKPPDGSGSQGQVGEHLVLGRDLRHLQLE